MTTTRSNKSPERVRKIAIASTGAFVLALVIFIAVVLPAEFDRDPLGTGALLGLDALNSETVAAYQPHLVPHKTDEVELILEPFQSLEYKYRLDAGSGMVFSWESSGPLYVDMHAENTGTENGGEASFRIEEEAQNGMGVYTAPFIGLHGWFWENRTLETVVLRIHAAGFFIDATEFRSGGSTTSAPEAVFGN
ncbi:hypothetical protein GCM10011403_06940 [Pseudohongiella nitratireducens]|uniref:Uncharacterized protein n=1 Tax=Pseudohongiella nitratireducens TaxID=1768907 RepID=A0A917GP05_9GAMM|nr:hypothetical protein [Pseudohongiella nitratireducens]GGG52349.1 hypothetical protein GCM10011403_06940 [Pseudohongiella nitratireducens]|tara:strand:+ start:348 stop:926 length:579 start_codon:yes stop_codon:yes gene_type:complete